MTILPTASRKLLATIGFTLFSQFTLAQGIPDYIQRAVASPARVEAMTSRDALRHPAETLVLSGIKPGDTVIELAGFGQYYTTLLSEIVGDNGKVLVYDPPFTEPFGAEASRAFAAVHANTEYHLVDYNTMELPGNVDIAYNVLFYHDLFNNDIDAAALNRKIFNALKPGGVFLIIDHNAAPGSGTRDTGTLHRIDPEVIKRDVTAAGFVLAEESKLLANPQDDHTQGVFADRGQTDQSVFKFVKP